MGAKKGYASRGGSTTQPENGRYGQGDAPVRDATDPSTDLLGRQQTSTQRANDVKNRAAGIMDRIGRAITGN